MDQLSLLAPSKSQFLHCLIIISWPPKSRVSPGDISTSAEHFLCLLGVVPTPLIWRQFFQCSMVKFQLNQIVILEKVMWKLSRVDLLQPLTWLGSHSSQFDLTLKPHPLWFCIGLPLLPERPTNSPNNTWK